MDSFMYTNIDFPDVSDDMRERIITSIQSMIYAESAKEALRRLKMYEYQQKTGKPALVKKFCIRLNKQQEQDKNDNRRIRR